MNERLSEALAAARSDSVRMNKETERQLDESSMLEATLAADAARAAAHIEQLKKTGTVVTAERDQLRARLSAAPIVASGVSGSFNVQDVRGDQG